jgi:EAL domain-containing protein (putative c-di-GMP-specific phosphodiesterase class I)
VDILEIDRSSGTGIQDAHSAAPLVAPVLALARSMAVRVVAEGAEVPVQAGRLRGHGCEEAQGFLRSRAVPGTRPAGAPRAAGGRGPLTGGGEGPPPTVCC